MLFNAGEMYLQLLDLFFGFVVVLPSLYVSTVNPVRLVFGQKSLRFDMREGTCRMAREEHRITRRTKCRDRQTPLTFFAWRKHYLPNIGS